MTDGAWVSLFSGGKDSSWALYRALERGYSVERLLTVHPEGDSYMYHVPETRLAGLAAESIGIPLVEVEPADFRATAAVARKSRVTPRSNPWKLRYGASPARSTSRE